MSLFLSLGFPRPWCSPSLACSLFHLTPASRRARRRRCSVSRPGPPRDSAARRSGFLSLPSHLLASHLKVTPGWRSARLLRAELGLGCADAFYPAVATPLTSACHPSGCHRRGQPRDARTREKMAQACGQLLPRLLSEAPAVRFAVEAELGVTWEGDGCGCDVLEVPFGAGDVWEAPGSGCHPCTHPGGATNLFGKTP